MTGEIIISIILILGSIFFLIASIGIIRLPSMELRIHSAVKAPSLGIMLLLIAVIIAFPGVTSIIKSIAIIFFIYLTNPLAASLLFMSFLSEKKDSQKNDVYEKK